MTKWTDEEIATFKNAQTLQNRPYNDDKTTFEEDNPVWEVTVDNQVFIRGAKGVNDTKWYQAGTKNGGQIEVADQKFEVKYQAVNNAGLIKDVTEAFNKKYHGQYPIDLMVSDLVAQATVALVKR
ncbi:DUF2255 family protein [Lactobacillus paragasseri]|uniref:DUF2255 family protein n=1 Tax=Lactobacillus paragasseri TaxID=2107999 RepID=UPI0012E1C831|nr:DUF2255 family protein [Lactobacillus paragasseri]MDK8085640.1 DUF2255 family protein [Lactobacillus paragasseri]MDX5117583.1 DUF2255 family protein [Lactobacillus paragasseri]MDX5121463.1 DUF2255 family protein [Lactobacillus paragasseri]QGT97775.1 DUF2255 family protein [Lactobacillus paragasseri]UWI46990.1 DUF2255 family protein [Lactobacillus paragasseri]